MENRGVPRNRENEIRSQLIKDAAESLRKNGYAYVFDAEQLQQLREAYPSEITIDFEGDGIIRLKARKR
ncbi:MAG: hypothetical protein WC251_04435 [Candidatus Izemoplasmatales bacterium]|jgi:hypothetical protein